MQNTNNKNKIKVILAGYIAAFIFVLLAFAIGKNETSEEIVEVPETQAAADERKHYVKPASSLKELDIEDVFEPGPDKLNLAFFYPDDADTTDSINSYAGKIYTDMTSINAEYFAEYYDLTDNSPAQLASRYGLGADRVMGNYNADDPKHDPNNPATWTVNSFKNVNVSFYDGDGNRINGYYTVQEIMSMASVYAYYHDMDDAEAMENYCRELFNSSVKAKVSLGNVYYCSGCSNRTVEEEATEAMQQESQQGQLENSLGLYSSYVAVNSSGNVVGYVNYSENGAHTLDDRIVVSTTAEVQSTEYSGTADNAVVSSGNTVAESTSAPETSVAETGSEYSGGIISETEHDMISDTPSDHSVSNGIDDNVVVSYGKDYTPSTTAVPDIQESIASIHNSETVYLNGVFTADDDVVVSPASKPLSTTAADDTEAEDIITDAPVSTSAPAETNTADQTGGQQTAQSSSAANTAVTNVPEQNHTQIVNDPNQPVQPVQQAYCHGHIDLYVSITVKCLDDKKGLFSIDSIGNNKDNFNDEWQGWTEDKIALANALNAQDWFETYGLSISSIKVSSQLTEEEIQAYLESLPATVSETRKAVVEFALHSVGKVPYYWGGKPAGPGYESNSFYKLIGADYRGRILCGLDCSGWVNWVYWSATGNSLPGESTGSLIGCGKRISRSALQPGDIIVRTGADAHVVMFLCWSQNGKFIGIHETGGAVNNVIVSEVTASWPYYRSLCD